ncbi:MAG: class I SAM-dependent methyltransferase [candidate division Zixibacteria bacterium]|nr:class I SAM-dependent methyltransferase [candidate division Zixibacteria bacterium]
MKVSATYEFLMRISRRLLLPKPIIPQIELEKITPLNIESRIIYPLFNQSNASLFENIVIGKIIKYRNPKRIFEFGTFDGKTTLTLSANSSPDAEVFTLDLPQHKSEDAGREEWKSNFKGTEYEDKIIQLLGDSTTFDYSPYHKNIDLIFIDASHEYDYVLNDSDKALMLIKDSAGIILWHDYDTTWTGLTKALNELYSGQKEFRGLRHIKDTSLIYLSLYPE